MGPTKLSVYEILFICEMNSGQNNDCKGWSGINQMIIFKIIRAKCASFSPIIYELKYEQVAQPTHF